MFLLFRCGCIYARRLHNLSFFVWQIGHCFIRYFVRHYPFLYQLQSWADIDRMFCSIGHRKGRHFPTFYSFKNAYLIYCILPLYIYIYIYIYIQTRQSMHEKSIIIYRYLQTSDIVPELSVHIAPGGNKLFAIEKSKEARLERGLRKLAVTSANK